MYKVYRCGIISLIINIICMICAVGVVFMVSYNIFGEKIAIISSVIVAMLFVFYIISGIRTKVVVTDDELKICCKKKEYSYKLGEVSFRSVQRNSVLSLYVTDKNGNSEEFDLTFLGQMKYDSLIEDIGIVGEKSSAVKVDVIKKQ